MEQIIARLLGDFESGKMNRRQLIQSLALAATAADWRCASDRKAGDRTSGIQIWIGRRPCSRRR